MAFPGNSNSLDIVSRVIQRIQSIDNRIDSITGNKTKTDPSLAQNNIDGQSFQQVMGQIRGQMGPRANKWIVEDAIQKAGLSTGMDVDLLKSVMQTESNGDSNAISSAGAKGLMQLMDPTANELGVTDPFDPHQNALGGAKYLKKQMERFNGDMLLALAAYNAGPEAVEKHKGIPPYNETIDYIKKVESNYREIKSQQNS